MWIFNNEELRKTWKTTRDWWLSPVLQGEENDYGDYDYLIEEIPNDTAHWINYPCKCESCGKQHRFNYRQYHYFYTMDGYDEMDYTQCWKCTLEDKIKFYKKLIKQNIENKRTHFFGQTKIGWKLAIFTGKMAHKYPTKFWNTISYFCLPF